MNVVIIGGGLGAVRAARLLARDRRIHITLVSKERYLYAGDLLEARKSEHPALSLGSIFAAHPNVTIAHDTITSLDPAEKIISGKHTYAYDELVLALGTVPKTKHQPNAYGIDLQAVQDTPALSITIIGAGATGVAVAGTLQSAGAHVSLVEQGPSVVPTYSRTARRKVLGRLKKLGVSVIFNHAAEPDGDEVRIDHRLVTAKNVLWATGTVPALFGAKFADVFAFSHTGRPKVDSTLRIAPHISIIGDSSELTDATYVARRILAVVHKRQHPDHKPSRLPVVIPVDPDWTYVESYGIYVAGRFGTACRHLLEFQLLAMAIGLKAALALQSVKKAKKL